MESNGGDNAQIHAAAIRDTIKPDASSGHWPVDLAARKALMPNCYGKQTTFNLCVICNQAISEQDSDAVWLEYLGIIGYAHVNCPHADAAEEKESPKKIKFREFL